MERLAYIWAFSIFLCFARDAAVRKVGLWAFFGGLAFAFIWPFVTLVCDPCHALLSHS